MFGKRLLPDGLKPNGTGKKSLRDDTIQPVYCSNFWINASCSVLR